MKKIIVIAALIALGACSKSKAPNSAPSANQVKVVQANSIDDVNPVLKIEGTIATLERKMPERKVGDFVYFPREPFRFKISAISPEGQVQVDLGTNHDVKVGQMLLKNPTEAILMAIVKMEGIQKATSNE